MGKASLCTKPIYLDYNATTPVDKAVVEAMLPYFAEHFGNPSSTHAYGVTAREATEQARAQVAALLGCKPEETFFTSGGTESNNAAIIGVASALASRGSHIITSKIEHPSVLKPCIELLHRGFEVTFLPVDRYGMVDPDDLRKALKRETVLISLMHANNEVGTIEPIEALTAIAHERGILVHCDAAQSVGKISVRVHDLGVDLLTVAGHKLYAPKGVGVLFCREGIPRENILFGAAQERGMRPGTENVPAIVALGKAAQIAMVTLSEEQNRLRRLRNTLREMIQAWCPHTMVQGHPTLHLPNTLSISFYGMTADAILRKMPHIAASTGAACHAGEARVSHVLEAMGVEPAWALGTIRLSLGRFTTEEEVYEAARTIGEAVASR